MGIEDNSLRADLEAAFSEAEKAGEAPTTPSDPPSAELVATPEAPAAPAADLDAESRTIDRPDGRDDKGRFAPKAKDAAPEQKSLAAPPQAPSTAPAATDAAPPSPAQPSPAAADLRAPSSWKPAAREKWAALPPEIQQEVVRVDREIRQTMQETAAVRRFAS